MKWSTVFSSAIGKKLIMAATGLFLITFLLVHCYINAMVFYNDGGASFNVLAHFMGSNPVIRIIEIGLMAFLVIHSVWGIRLWLKNKSRRTVGYAVNNRSQNSNWYSRSMGILGTLILLFLIMHLWAFWAPNRANQLIEGEELDLFQRMADTFANPLIVIIYVLGCISLGWHLVHGFWSSFQTFGLTTHRYKGQIRAIGTVFSILIPLLFALMPLWFYAGSQGWFDMKPSVFGQQVEGHNLQAPTVAE